MYSVQSNCFTELSIESALIVKLDMLVVFYSTYPLRVFIEVVCSATVALI